MRRRLAWLLPLLAWGATAWPAEPGRAAREITVFAAASLTETVGELVQSFERSTPARVTASFAASSALARQIEAGAPVDIFISADIDWMDYLEARDLVQTASRRNLLGNSLVLVAPATSAITLAIRPGFDLAGALGPSGRLALADPDSVPAGRYARAALESLDAWQPVAGRIVGAENVRAALAFVARGETPLGIVYATDARAEPRVRVVARFPPDSHPPIVYPAALVRGAGDEAGAFLAYLGSAEAATVFEKAGFTILTR